MADERLTAGALEGKTAVITGASSGIGLAIAQSFAGAGMNLVLGARSEEKLAQVANGLGPRATAVVTDVMSESATTALMSAAVDLHGGIDVLIANAGVYVGGDFAGGDLQGYVELIDTNVSGVIRSVHAALAHMVPAGTGDIVITSSVSGYQAIHWEPVYSASKHALQALTHTLRRQLVGTGVRVGSVAPGIVLNALWDVTGEDTVAAGVAAGTGLRSEDVADAVLYMVSRPRHVNIRDLVLLPLNQEI
jgi:ribitol 2-dehydrogenase